MKKPRDAFAREAGSGLANLDQRVGPHLHVMWIHIHSQATTAIWVAGAGDNIERSIAQREIDAKRSERSGADLERDRHEGLQPRPDIPSR